MPHCQAFGCSNHTGRDKKSFFQVPNPETHPELCKKWLNAISVKKFDFKSFKSSRFNVICEDHFTEDCFEEDIRSKIMGTKPRKLLKPDAVPTLFVHRPAPKVRESSVNRIASTIAKKYIESIELHGSAEQDVGSSSKSMKRPADKEKGTDYDKDNAGHSPRHVPEKKKKKSNPSLSQGEEYNVDISEQPSQPVPDEESSLHLQDGDPSKSQRLPSKSARKAKKGKKTKNIRLKKSLLVDTWTQTDDRDTLTVGVQTEASVASFSCQFPEEPAPNISQEHSYSARPIQPAAQKLPVEVPPAALPPPPLHRFFADVQFVPALIPIDEHPTSGALPALCIEVTSAEQEPAAAEKDGDENSTDSSSHSSAQPQTSSSSSLKSSSASSISSSSSSSSSSSKKKNVSEESKEKSEEKETSPSQGEETPSGVSEDTPSRPSKDSSSSYHPDPDSESSSAEEPDPEELEFCKEKKYFVFDSKLDLLFYSLKCSECTFGHIDNISKSYVGSLVKAIVTCSCGNEVLQWESQPKIGRAPVGNFIGAAAILLSGNTFKTVNQLVNLMGMQFFSETVFYDIQRSLLVPVVNNYYLNHTNMLVQKYQDEKLWLSGDGRCDSPGYNAKYCSYTMMEMTSQEIVAFDLVQVTQTTSSVAMEKMGFKNCMSKMETSGLTVDVVATDRHVGIRKLLREDYADVDHEFDIWHLTKSVSKKLTAKARLKECEDLGPWINSVKNHLWYCAQHCNGSYEVLLEMWTSIVHHVSNIHHWNSAQHFHQCSHDPLSENEVRSKKWIAPGSKAHKALSEVVFDKRLTKDLQHVTKACHTGNLEVFHSVLLKYCPKRLHFSYPVMQARLQLAVLDNNNNVGREQAVVGKVTTKSGPKGSKRWRYSYSKAAKQWLSRPVMEKKDYEYLWEMMIDVLRMKQGTLQPQLSEVPEVPPNIAPLPRPSVAELQAKAKSRFVNI